MSICEEAADRAARQLALGADLNKLEDNGAAFDAVVFYRAAELHAEALEKSAAVAFFEAGDAVSRDSIGSDDAGLVEAARFSAEGVFEKFFDEHQTVTVAMWDD